MTPSFWTCGAWPERSEAEFISENLQDSEIGRDLRQSRIAQPV